MYTQFSWLNRWYLAGLWSKNVISPAVSLVNHVCFCRPYICHTCDYSCDFLMLRQILCLQDWNSFSSMSSHGKSSFVSNHEKDLCWWPVSLVRYQIFSNFVSPVNNEKQAAITLLHTWTLISTTWIINIKDSHFP